MASSKQIKTQARPADTMMRESISKETVVLQHLGNMSRMVLLPTTSREMYNNSVIHLGSLLKSLQDETFKKNSKKLEAEYNKKHKKLVEDLKGAIDGLDYEKEDLIRHLIAEARNEFCQLLFVELNTLCDRCGIGWSRENIADFAGYRQYLKDSGGRPAPAQSDYAVQIAKEIHDNVHVKRRNWICLIIGKVGSGKSYSALSLARMFDPTFDLSRVVFDERSLMELARSDLKPGSFIDAEEVGAWMGNRDWQSESNRILSTVLQTFRNRQLCIVWSLPQRRMADINLRSMCDHIIEVVDIWPESRRCLAKLKSVHVSPQTGNEKTPFPVLKDSRGRTTITRILIPHPGAISKSYEAKKKRWQDELYEGFQQRLDGMGREKKEKRKKKDDILRLIGEGRGSTEIAKEVGCSITYVKDLRRIS